MKAEISLGSATSNHITGNTTPAQAVADIQSGKWAKQVAALRLATGDERDQLKKNLPAFLWSGTFSRRANDGLIQRSGLTCADIDKVAERVAELHDIARTDPHAVAAFVSPTGTGLKIIFRADNFAAVRAHVASHYSAQVDEAAKDVARLCFVSHDPAAFYNADALPLAMQSEPATVASVQPLAAPSAIQPSTRTQIAERILGAIEWTDASTGFCKCPGEHLHTTANAAKDCKLMLDGVPTIKCFHSSCSGIVGGVNHELRSQIAKAEFVPTWTPQAAPDPLPGNDDAPSEAEAAQTASGFTIRTPDEILAMVFTDDDIILGDRMMAEGQSCVIAAAGGMGKSRIVLQLIACIVTGRKFLNFDTGRPDSKWLVLQTENSNRRLHEDLQRLKSWLGDDWHKFAAQVKLHTVETDTDGFMNLDSPEAVANIEAAIQQHAPDIIVIDPLNDCAIGDPSKDADMKATVQAVSRICRRGNPKRAILVLHHAITGKSGAAKATGFDRASFGRNSKALLAWTRSQFNIAPVDPDSNERLIIACGKCNNGREFQTFAVRLNLDTMIYEVDPTVDVTQWQNDITGTKDTAPLMNPDRVRELCATAGSSKAALAKAIMDDCGCYRGSAYRYITRADQAKKIAFNKSHGTYFRK